MEGKIEDPSIKVDYQRMSANNFQEVSPLENFSLLENESCNINLSSDSSGSPRLTKKTISTFILTSLILVFSCASVYLITLEIYINNNNDKIHIAASTGLNSTKCVEYTINSKITSSCYNDEKDKLLKYLRLVSNFNSTISGIYMAATDDDVNIGLQKLNRATGVFPGIVSLTMPHYAESVDKWNLFVDEAISKWNNSYLVSIDWHSGQNPFTIKTEFTSTTDGESKWQELIQNGSHLNQLWKNQLDIIVPYFKRLQTSGVIAILEIIPTINFKTYIWRGRPGINGTAKLYRITHDYLTKHHKLTAFIWTWSLSNYNMYNFEQYYPGHDYVDVASVYMGTSKELLTGVYQRLLNILGDKPISLENMYTTPTPEYFTRQVKWTWFTLCEQSIDMKSYNSPEQIQTEL